MRRGDYTTSSPVSTVSVAAGAPHRSHFRSVAAPPPTPGSGSDDSGSAGFVSPTPPEHDGVDGAPSPLVREVDGMVGGLLSEVQAAQAQRQAAEERSHSMICLYQGALELVEEAQNLADGDSAAAQSLSRLAAEMQRVQQNSSAGTVSRRIEEAEAAAAQATRRAEEAAAEMQRASARADELTAAIQELEGDGSAQFETAIESLQLQLEQAESEAAQTSRELHQARAAVEGEPAIRARFERQAREAAEEVRAEMREELAEQARAAEASAAQVERYKHRSAPWLCKGSRRRGPARTRRRQRRPSGWRWQRRQRAMRHALRRRNPTTRRGTTSSCPTI